MIIELVGLPGSGKTTFAKRLAEDGRWTTVSIAGVRELVFYNALFFLWHPINFFRGFFWLVRYRGLRELWYTKFVNLFLVHNAKYMKARKYPRAVIDQGHHQNIISLFDLPVANGVIDRYVQFLPKPDLLCFFLADDETRTKRLAERGYGARGELDENYREAWEEARAGHFERLYVSRGGLSCATETISPNDEAEKQEKITHARLWYFILHGRMPTEKAHGLQIAKTIEALTMKGVYATLWIPFRKNTIVLSINEYYGLSATFPVRVFPVPDLLRLPAFFGPFRFWVDALGFFFILIFTRIDREGVFSTRNPELAWLFKMKGASVWYEAHSFPVSKRRLLKFFLHNIDGIIANSQGTANAFLAHGFTNIHVVRNGVDIARFSGIPAKEGAREILKLPNDKTIIMYVGAFYEWKGVPFLLETWHKHFSKHNELLLVLVGGTEDELKRYGGVGAYHATANVRLEPHILATEIPLYLSAADILVLPNVPTSEESIRHTSPIKLFEYMASGRPIVAADLPSVREIVSEETAVLFKAGDVLALAEGIEKVIHTPSEAKKLSERARAHVHSYSWDARAQLLMSIVRGHAKNRVSTHAQFLKMLASGGLSAVLSLSLVYILTEYFKLWYAHSVFIAYVCAMVVNFSLLKLVFVGGSRRVGHEFSIYFLLALVNLFINEIATYVLVEWFNVWYMLAQLLIMGTLAVTNFFMYRAHVFRRKER